jgi:hypothetical protein
MGGGGALSRSIHPPDLIGDRDLDQGSRGIAVLGRSGVGLSLETEGSGGEPDFEQSGLSVAQVYPQPDRDREQPRVGAACEKATGEWSRRRRTP